MACTCLGQLLGVPPCGRCLAGVAFVPDNDGWGLILYLTVFVPGKPRFSTYLGPSLFSSIMLEARKIRLHFLASSMLDILIRTLCSSRRAG